MDETKKDEPETYTEKRFDEEVSVNNPIFCGQDQLIDFPV